jgi:hypothetical protein
VCRKKFIPTRDDASTAATAAAKRGIADAFASQEEEEEEDVVKKSGGASNTTRSSREARYVLWVTCFLSFHLLYPPPKTFNRKHMSWCKSLILQHFLAKWTGKAYYLFSIGPRQKLRQNLSLHRARR